MNMDPMHAARLAQLEGALLALLRESMGEFEPNGIPDGVTARLDRDGLAHVAGHDRAVGDVDGGPDLDQGRERIAHPRPYLQCARAAALVLPPEFEVDGFDVCEAEATVSAMIGRFICGRKTAS